MIGSSYFLKNIIVSLLFISYLVNSLILVILWCIFLKKYTNIWGLFFCIFCIATSFWLIVYLFTLFTLSDIPLLLLLWKSAYFLSIISLYSFLLFLAYFQKKKQKLLHPLTLSFFFICCFLGYIYLGTSAIIGGIQYNIEQQHWYESQWLFYSFHVGISMLFIPWALFLSLFRLSRISSIDKKRFQFILWWIIFFIVSTIFCLLILPLFWVFLFEKYITFLLFPFIIGVFYSMRRYDFLNLKLTFIHIIWFIYSLSVSFWIVTFFRILWKYYFSENFKAYWEIWEDSFFIEIFIWIIVFLGTSFFLKKKVFPYLYTNHFWIILEKIKSQVPFILNIDELDRFLQTEFTQKFWIQKISLTEKTTKYSQEIKTFFERNISNTYFLNDISFIEEHRFWLWKKISYEYIPHSIYIRVFPS